MIRVDEDNLCPICGKSDWCLIAEDGSAAICARISEGAAKECGSAGWLHILSGDFKPVKQKKTKSIPINWNVVQHIYTANRAPAPNWFHTPIELYKMGLGWCDGSWTLPIFNGQHQIIGIQRRTPEGKKRFIKGSRHGIFTTVKKPVAGGTLFICEGATDTATAMVLGYKAVGRTCCTAGIGEVIEWLSRIYYESIYIISDNDEHKAGQRGAKKLADKILALKLPLKSIIIPSAKDLTEWYKGAKNDCKKYLESF